MDKLFLLLFFVCLFLSSRPTLGQNYENIAIGKTYSISNRYTNDGDFSLSNAANGNTGGTFIATGPNSNCIHTAGGTGQDWWEVDLGYNYPIYSIKVWGRTDSYNWKLRLYPFNITVDQALCATVEDGDNAQDVTCSSVLLGRRVRITLTQVRECCLNLCELQINVCSAGWYGAQCNQQCPTACPGNTCDRLTGQCFYNIAPGKTYAISGKYTGSGNIDFSLSNAANGNTTRDFYPSTGSSGNCIHTVPYASEHWWQVDLGNSYPIYNLKVWGRGDANRLYPFDITVDGTQCASLTTGLTEQAVTCTSVITGRVVRLTSRPTECCLNLCELQIYVPACDDGVYGPNCNLTCSPTGCERCDKFTGQCRACNGTYNLVPPNCTDCLPGYYRANGIGAPCTNCTWQCYNNEPCNQNNGSCARCPPGLQGDRCQEACDQQKYGQDCAMDCSVHCNYNSGQTTCNAVNGSCPNCQAGYKPTLCDQECDNGTYDVNCQETCGNCKDKQACNKVTGHCPRCELGYKEPFCKQACDTLTYGQDCAERCGQCKYDTNHNTCHAVTGYCPSCQPGFQPPLCLQECVDGWYGENCTLRCGPCGGNTVCDKVTGACTCPIGKQPPLCVSDCQNKTYGQDCSDECGQCKDGEACHPVTGDCPAGCDPGYLDKRCQTAIPNKDEPSALLTAVIVPVVLVVVVVVIAIILIMWWRRRRSSRSGSNGDEGVVNYVATSEESKRNDHPAPAVNIPSTHNQADNNDHLQPSYANDDPDRRPYSLHGKPQEASVYSDPDETSVYTEPNEAPQYTEAKEEGNNYESLHPYSNDDGDRQPYTRLASLNVRK